MHYSQAAVVIGNGESRGSLDLANLKNTVTLIGCNAIHRDIVVDHLVCCDQRMVKEAEANAEEDKKRKETIETKNHADALVHSTEKALSEHGSAVSSDEKAAIETDLAALKEALTTEDKDDIQAKMQTLTQSSMKLGEAAYKASQPTEGAEASADATKPEGENIVDAEYEVKDDDRKKA